DIRLARKIFRKAYASTAFLYISAEKCGLFAMKKAALVEINPIPKKTIAAFLKHDLLKPHQKIANAYILNENGRAFYRRICAIEKPFQEQHQQRAFFASARGKNISSTPLRWLYHRRNFISEHEYRAGELLYNDYEKSRNRTRLTTNWHEAILENKKRAIYVNPTERASLSSLAAKEQFEQALDAVGYGLGDIMVAVCCEQSGLEETERRFSLPRRSAKIILKIALQQLAIFYGLATASSFSASAHIRETIEKKPLER
ncbi:MAG: DUF6456 domain-containing protein, partial [Parvibaculales bacterium]